jgi:uncharacterized ferritin-like protein (DUF455 family)
MIERFVAAGDNDTAAVLRIILHDEVAHVAVGTRWFHWLCQQRGQEPERTWRRILDEYGVAVAGPARGAASARRDGGDRPTRQPYNVEARAAAGLAPYDPDPQAMAAKFSPSS